MLNPITGLPVLSQSDLEDLKAAEHMLAASLPLINAAEACGEPVEMFKQQHAYLTQKIGAIRAHFAPAVVGAMPGAGA